MSREQGPKSGHSGIWQLALPTITGNVIFAFTAMIQTRFVGSLGPQAVAAVGVSQRVLMTMQALFLAISIGMSALTARAWGADDRRETAHVLTTGIVVTLIVSALFSVVCLALGGPIASIFGLDGPTTAEAAVNIRWLGVFVIGFAINVMVLAALRAVSDVIRPLVVVFITNIAMVGLLYLLVFGHGGLPRMNGAGAPVSLGLANLLSGIVLLVLWRRDRLPIRYDVSRWRERERYRRLIDIGYPAGLEQFCTQAGMLLFLALIGHYYGKEAFAAYAIGTNMLNLAIVVGFGFSIAGSTLVGQHLGAGEFQAARKAGWRAAMFAVGSMSAIALVTTLFAEALARFFIGDQELTVRYTVQFTYILSAMLPLLGIEFAIGGSLRGAGDTRFPLITTFTSLLIARVGLALLTIHLHLPVAYIYGVTIVEYGLRAALLIWRFRSGRWQHAIAGRLALSELERAA